MDIAYAVDLARGVQPLTFDRGANPDGLAPVLLRDREGNFLRLAVQRGAYAGAIRGEPECCDRCELRDPDKLPMECPAWYGFALRIAPGFPATDLRFVAAQVKANGGASPLFALRIESGRLFADWRVGSVAVEHRGFSAGPGGWLDIMLGFVGDRAELWLDGRQVAGARAAFREAGATRFLKLGPYRDKHPGWGDAPAAIDFRKIRRGATRASVEGGAGRAASAA